MVVGKCKGGRKSGRAPKGKWKMRAAAHLDGCTLDPHRLLSPTPPHPPPLSVVKSTFLVCHFSPPCLFVFFFFNFFSTFIYFWDRERQSMNGGGAEREGDTESETGSRL